MAYRFDDEAYQTVLQERRWTGTLLEATPEMHSRLLAANDLLCDLVFSNAAFQNLR